MSIMTIILATIVALVIYIFIWESIATQSEATSRVFNRERRTGSSVSAKRRTKTNQDSLCLVVTV